MDRESLTFKQFMSWLIDKQEFVSGGLRRNGGVKVTLDGDDRYKFDTLDTAAEEIAQALGVDPPWEPAAPLAEEDEWPVCPSCKGTGEKGVFCDGGTEPDCPTCQGKGYIAEQEASPVADREPGIGDRVVYYDGDEPVDKGTVICEQEDNPSRWVLSTGATPLKSDCRLALPHPPVADPPDAAPEPWVPQRGDWVLDKDEPGEWLVTDISGVFCDLVNHRGWYRYNVCKDDLTLLARPDPEQTQKLAACQDNAQKLGADYHEVAEKLAAAEARVAELESQLAEESDSHAEALRSAGLDLAMAVDGAIDAARQHTLEEAAAAVPGPGLTANPADVIRTLKWVNTPEATQKAECRAAQERGIRIGLERAAIEMEGFGGTGRAAAEAIRALAGADAPEVTEPEPLPASVEACREMLKSFPGIWAEERIGSLVRPLVLHSANFPVYPFGIAGEDATLPDWQALIRTAREEANRG